MKLTARLSVLLLLFASCTKTVTQVQQVDQAFSVVYTLNPGGWGSQDGGYSWSTTLDVPEIDQQMLTHGAVIIYLSFDQGANYEAIPEVFEGISYGSVHALGKVYLDLHAVDGSKITGPNGTILAKVVLVQGSPL